MKNLLNRAAPLLLTGFLLAACSTWNQPKSLTAELLLDTAVETVATFRTHPDLKKFNNELNNAHAVVILPTVIKAGFFAGGEGGNGVLLKHNADGSWSYPTYLTLGAASFGLQLGIQDTAIILIVRSPGAMDSLLKHQGKIGADAGATIWVEGVGMEASTTSNLGADILAFASSNVGGYLGASLEGAVLATRRDLNEAFYGEGAVPLAILAGQYQNPIADTLRQFLAKK
ncbi:MAG: lipid-binding SYLF domain-containing protein [Rhodospirillales bacterium]|nr:lipid-binding SYLF domain-containing protein [Rhodospirillales bacterium]